MLSHAVVASAVMTGSLRRRSRSRAPILDSTFSESFHYRKSRLLRNRRPVVCHFLVAARSQNARLARGALFLVGISRVKKIALPRKMVKENSGSREGLKARNETKSRGLRRPQAVRSAEMRRRLLNATINLIIERGYSQFRSADVATRANVSRGALLHHFRTKDALVVAALEDLYRVSTAESDNRLMASGPNVKLRDVLEDSEKYYYADEFLATVELVMSAGRNRGLSDKIKKITYRSRQPLEERWSRKLSERGIPMDVARDAIWLVQAVIRGLRVRMLVSYPPKQVMRVRNLTLQLIEAFLFGSNADLKQNAEK
jgi:AcrR family transcriptional regulator